MGSPAADRAPAVPVTAPIVAGAADGAEADALLAAAARLGVVELSRHPVGHGRWLVQLAPGPTTSPSRRLFTDGTAGGGPDEKVDEARQPLLEGTAGGGSRGELVGRAVAALRATGFAVLAGPPTEGHATVWARRNGPSWFAPGACACFPWSPVDRAATRLTVEIDPGAGFGAGGHPTTLGLLAGLVDPAVVGAPAGPDGLADLGGRRVLDVGCGTGVLGIAAALAGAASVDALDIAPGALAATRANAARNGVTDRVTLVDADLARCTRPYDLVLANIHADVLMAMASDLRRLVVRAAEPRDRDEPPGDSGGPPRSPAPPEGIRGPEPDPREARDRGGLLGVSGLSVAQVSRLEAALAPLRTVHRHHLDDWVTLWLRW